MTARHQGRAAIARMIAAGYLERVPPDSDGACALISRARTHLESAAALGATDIALAYDALHAANRKALTALLIAQGLRPTRAAGHTGVFDAARAQFDPPLGLILAPYTRIRRTRNAGDYLDDLAATADDVVADLPLCEAIVAAAEDLLPGLAQYD